MAALVRRVVSWLEGLKGVDGDDGWIPAQYEIPLDGIFVPRDVVRRVMRAPLMPRSMAMGGAMNGGGGGRVMWYRCPGAVVRYCGETTVGPRGGVTVRLDSSMGAQVCVRVVFVSSMNGGTGGVFLCINSRAAWWRAFCQFTAWRGVL